MQFDSIDDVLADIRDGKFIAIVDDEGRENEADLVFAAEKVTPAHIAFLAEHAKGMICFSMTAERMQRLGLPEQQRIGASPLAARYGVSFDLKTAAADGGTAQGVAATIAAALSPAVKAEDFVIPGHVFPIAAVAGGVLKRRGHTEASSDLAKLAGLEPAAVICEVMSPEGTMLRGKAVQDYCSKHSIKLTSVEEILRYRLRKETSIRRVAQCAWTPEMGIDRGEALDQLFRTFSGELNVYVYLDDVTDEEHFALVVGNPVNETLVRIHSECLTGDVFGSERCDCGPQFDAALNGILTEGSGVLIYLHQEGRGIGLGNKLRAYELQDRGLDTVDANLHLGFSADLREYRVAAQVLNDLGVSRVRLMTNNPDKLQSLVELGIEVAGRVSLSIKSSKYNQDYLATKQARMGHLLSD